MLRLQTHGDTYLLAFKYVNMFLRFANSSLACVVNSGCDAGQFFSCICYFDEVEGDMPNIPVTSKLQERFLWDHDVLPWNSSGVRKFCNGNIREGGISTGIISDNLVRGQYSLKKEILQG